VFSSFKLLAQRNALASSLLSFTVRGHPSFLPIKSLLVHASFYKICLLAPVAQLNNTDRGTSLSPDITGYIFPSSVAPKRIWKWGGAGTRPARIAGNFFCRAPPLFWLYKYNQSFWWALMVTTVWSVSCLLFHWRCLRAQPFVKVGSTCHRALWSRRQCHSGISPSHCVGRIGEDVFFRWKWE